MVRCVQGRRQSCAARAAAAATEQLAPAPPPGAYTQPAGQGLGFYTGDDGYLYCDGMRIDDIRDQALPAPWGSGRGQLAERLGCPLLAASGRSACASRQRDSTEPLNLPCWRPCDKSEAACIGLACGGSTARRGGSLRAQERLSAVCSGAAPGERPLVPGCDKPGVPQHACGRPRRLAPNPPSARHGGRDAGIAPVHVLGAYSCTSL